MKNSLISLKKNERLKKMDRKTETLIDGQKDRES